MYRDEDGSKLFDVLEQDSSRCEYGNVLGRLVCFYLRDLEEGIDSDMESESESELESELIPSGSKQSQ